LNREILEARTHETLVRAGAQFSWEWTALDGSLDRPLWPVARSAGELLTSADLAKVRECAGAHCGWLFVDTSKNRRRQWCYMEGGCGNLAKVHRYRERLRRSASR
jgi:predicted RNA-binding Zn ribbon-like protein